MDELTNLAIKYKTDKWGKHNYTPVYYDLFKDRRQEITKLLEIGPAEGAGLFMFRDFFPNATIYGAEISEKRVAALQGLDRIEVYRCDQHSWRDLEAMLDVTGRDFDIVIDDGSHKPEDQVFTAKWMLGQMKKGSTYIIEDVADKTIVNHIAQYNPYINILSDRYDDCLVVIEK